MLLITTELATFGNWIDCYKFMKEENLTQIKTIKTQYCFKDIIGPMTLSIEEVYQMAYEMND